MKAKLFDRSHFLSPIVIIIIIISILLIPQTPPYLTEAAEFPMMRLNPQLRLFHVLLFLVSPLLLLLSRQKSAEAWVSPLKPSLHPVAQQTPHLFKIRNTLAMAPGSSSSSAKDDQESIPRHNNNKKIVVVGGGIGGLSAAFDAKHILRNPLQKHDNVDVIVVSDRESFQFTPSNPWVATRQRTPQDISLSLTKILPRHNIEFVHSAVTKLHPQHQELTLANGEKLSYDFLVIATGPRLAFEEIPGMGPDKHTTSVCTTPHASEAAEAVDALVQNPGPVVVGAVQGSSCFGPAYEFALLLHHELGKRGGAAVQKACPITFVTSEPFVGHLGLNGAGDSRKILEKLFTKKGIRWITNCKVQKVTGESVSVEYLEESGEGKYTKHHTVLKSKFNMLIPAFRGIDVWKRVAGLTDSHGMVQANEYQQSTNYPNIFAIGVAVHLDGVDDTPVQTGPPKTGYMIESMGTAAIKNIKTILEYQKKHNNDEEYPELHDKALLHGVCITDFGNDGAIFVTLPQLPPRRTEVTIDGKVATLAKIAFEKYFLHKIESGDTDPYYEKYMLHLIGVDRTAKV